MLDYKKLSKEFSSKLHQFKKEELERWIEFDRSRELLDELLSGEKVSIDYITVSPSKLTDNRENIDSSGEINFALAA